MIRCAPRTSKEVPFCYEVTVDVANRPPATRVVNRQLYMGKQASISETSQVIGALLRAHLLDARGCVSKLRGPRASVHDMRVALRRLRTTLAAYRRYLGAWALPTERALGALAQKVDFLRDSEVQLSWLLEHRNELKSKQRAEAETLIKILRANKATSQRYLRLTWIPRFEKVSARLAGHVESIGTIRRQPSFVKAFRKVIKRRISHFRINARKVARRRKARDLHSIRIKGKQIRYLIEPFVKHSASLRRTEKMLETFQASLGDLHDIELLRSRCLEPSAKAGNVQQFRRLSALLKDEESVLVSKAFDALTRRRFSKTLKEALSSLRSKDSKTNRFFASSCSGVSP